MRDQKRTTNRIGLIIKASIVLLVIFAASLLGNQISAFYKGKSIDISKKFGFVIDDSKENESVNDIKIIEKVERKDYSKDYVIALIDTGVAEGIDNVIDRVAIIDEDDNYENSHGTKMAKAIVDEDESAKLLAIKALDKNGHGTVESVSKAIEYAIDSNVNIINLSFSGYSNEQNKAIEKEIKRATDKGILVIASAGNKGKDASGFIPGNIDDVIVVGASNNDGVRIESSNYGAKVDYFVEADNTSIASAKLSGKLAIYKAAPIDYQGVIAKLITDKEVFYNKEKNPKDEILNNITFSGFDSAATTNLILNTEVEVARDTGEYTYQRLILWTTAKLIGYSIDDNGDVVKAKIEFRQYLRAEKKLDGASVPIQWAADVQWYVGNTHVGTKIFPRPGEMVVGASNTRQTYDGSNANWKYSNPNYIWYSANYTGYSPQGALLQGPITFDVPSGNNINIKTKDVEFGTDITSNPVDIYINVPYAVTIRYHRNGASLINPHSSDYSVSGNYITKNTSTTIHAIINGESIGTNGLDDYNDTSGINLARVGYRIADSTKVFRATVGGTTKYFNQTSNYSSADFGGASGSNKNVDLYLNWTANTYTIAYNLNGGTHGTNHPTSATYDTVVNIDNPTRTGYTFAGWTMTNGNTSTAMYGTSSTTVTTAWSNASTKVKATYFKNLTPTHEATVTLVANWTANTYTIAYTLNGGTHGSSHPTSATYDAVVNISNPTRTGYTFAGWTMTNGNTSTAMYGTSSTTVTTSWSNASTKVKAQYFKNLTPTNAATVTLVANWTANTYTVEYYQGNNSTTVGATKIGESTHTYGTAKNLSLYSTFSGSLPASVPNSTWTFAGWCGSSPSYSVSYTDGQSVINLTSTNGGVVKIYAVFERNITFYSGVNKVTTTAIKQYYNPYGSRDYLNSVTPPALTAISGWTALGYRTNTTAGTATVTAGTSFKPTYDATAITYYGVYSKDYTANFYSGVSKATNNPITGTAYYNTNTSAVPTTTTITTQTAENSADITNWTESGWRDDETPAAREYTYGQTGVTIPIDTSNFYSIYTRTLTISYNGNGSTSGSTSNTTKTIYLNANNTTTSTQSITTRENGFTKTGYSPKNPVWNTAANGSGTAVAAGASYNPSLAYNATTFGKTLYAQWTANTYTITYKANGGTGSDVSDTVTYGESYTVKPYTTFTRTGYRLTAWNTVANGSGTAWAPGSITWSNAGNVTLYAQWTINTSKLTVNPNGGSVKVTSPTGGTQETITTSKTYTQNYNTTLTLTEPQKAPVEVVTTYTVTYNGNGGTVGTLTPDNTSVNVTHGTSYKFTTWTKSSTFYGNLSTDNKTYTFPANNNVTSTITANYGVDSEWEEHELLTLPYASRNGYEFLGWYTAATGGTKRGNAGQSYEPQSNETLYAHWQEYTATFYVKKDGANWSNSNIKLSLYQNGVEVYSIDDAVVSGDTITFHQINQGDYSIYASKGSGELNTIVNTGYYYQVGATAPLPDTTNQVNYYTLTLNKGTGISSTSGASVYLKNQTANIDATVSTGYTWDKWTKNSGDSPASLTTKATSVVITQATTLTANAKINTSKLTVNPNGGSVSVTSPTGGTAETITASKTYTQNYNTTLTLGTPTKADTSAPTTYTVTYKYNDESTADTTATATRTIVTMYTFSTWTKSSTFYGNLSTDNKTYTFPANNNVTSTITANYTSATRSDTTTSVTLPTPTRTGYTFKGWYTAATGGTKIGNGGASYTPTGNITMHAQWTAISYTIGYTLNSGSYGTNHPTSATYDQVVNISNPTRTGYTFAGWTMTNGNTSTAKYGTSNTTVTSAWNPATTKVTAEYFKNLRSTSGTVTLVANWTANTYQMLYNGNGGTQLVNSNLVGKYDGYYNNGNAHSTTATSWPDISGNNKNGTITNATWGSDHLVLDGTTWVNLGQMKSDYQTIEATFSIDALQSATQSIIGNWQSGGGGIYVTAAGKISGQYYINSAWQSINSSVTMEPNKVYHVALTYDGTTVRLYVNGEQVGTKSASGVIGAPGNSTVMGIGGNPSGSTCSPSFIGKMYNAAVYNTALTATQIANDGGKVVTYGSTYGTLPDAARAGYTFKGWYTAPSGGTKITSSSTVSTAGDHMLYAQWTANTSTITIKKDNGNWTTSNNVQVALYQGGSSKYAYNVGTKSGATISWEAVIAGTYDIYASKDGNNLTTLVDTGIDVVVSTTGTATIDYYTLTLNKGVGIAAVTGAGTYLKNQTANIDATVSTGYTWQGWSVVSGDSPN